jgi:S-formylglutathione hydrolase FrmB
MTRGLLALCLAFGAWAQPLPERLVLASRHHPALQAEIHLPADYAASLERRYPVCLLLHGGGGTAAGLRGLGLAGLATRHQILIVAPEAGPSLFVDPARGEGPRLETAILQELLPELDRRYRTRGAGRGRIVAGLSFGGFAALRFGILHPELFAVAVSLSGVVEAPRWSALEEDFLPSRMREQMDRAFGPAGSASRQEKDLFALVAILSPEDRRRLPLLRLECGTEDLFLPSNQRFAAQLQRLGIRHEFRTSPGKHDGEFWRSRLGAVLGPGE